MSKKKLHLQGLRGLAIIAVILFHFFPKWFPNGYLGVDQFFLLSGFLMTMMLRRHNSLNITVILDFLYRRVKRIVPLYYLITALTLVSINLMPKSAFEINFTSGIRAILFVTNLIRPLGNEDYAEKLGLAVDMFTHTWSLALEMQFYFLFPIIYILIGYFDRVSRSNCGIAGLGAVSLAFYLFSDSFLSFNFVFSRIWQFLAGMFVFINSIDDNNSIRLKDPEKQPLVEDKEDHKDRAELKKLYEIMNVVSISSMVLLLFGPHIIDTLFGRLNIILLTGLIVYLGEGSRLLKNQLIVFCGEISYCWYLVHWPIIALCKINGFTAEIELLYALVVSLFLTLIFHYGFERFYLKWEKETIVFGVLSLLLINGAALYQVYNRIPKVSFDIPINSANNTRFDNDSFIFASDYLENLQMGYENMTNEQRAQLNDDNNAKDTSRLFSFPCFNNTGQTRCQVGETKSFSEESSLTLLVLGNSYAQNVMGVIHNECRDVFSSMYITATAACEPLYRTTEDGYDCTVDDIFQTDAEKYQPDVVFIITRCLNGFKIFNGTNPFDDNNFSTAVKRIRFLEKIVKKKIYILDAFPVTSIKIIQIMNDYLRKGTPFDDSHLLKYGSDYQIAKERMARLVQGCIKCELFDYATQFYINGKFKIYYPKYHLSFFTQGRHLTPPGLERVRPLINRLCHHL